MFGRYWEDKLKSRLLFTQFPVHVSIGEPQQKSSWDFVSASLRFTPPPQYIGTYLDVDQIFSLGFCLFSVSFGQSKHPKGHSASRVAHITVFDQEVDKNG